MAKHTINGLIPFGVPRRDLGGYLTIGSIPAWSGRAVACLNHWDDNEVLLSYPAFWAATAEGLKIIHVLEDTIEFERAILERVRRGEIGFSYGTTDTPAKRKEADEWMSAWVAADPAALEYRVKHIRTIHHIGHLSYSDLAEVAFKQRPATVASE